MTLKVENMLGKVVKKLKLEKPNSRALTTQNEELKKIIVNIGVCQCQSCHTAISDQNMLFCIFMVGVSYYKFLSLHQVMDPLMVGVTLVFPHEKYLLVLLSMVFSHDSFSLCSLFYQVIGFCLIRFQSSTIVKLMMKVSININKDMRMPNKLEAQYLEKSKSCSFKLNVIFTSKPCFEVKTRYFVFIIIFMFPYVIS